MTKIISAELLRTQLNNLLDELNQGETHFIIERNQEVAGVLLSIEKFQEIMQMLEMLNSLDYIPAEDFEPENGLNTPYLSPLPTLNDATPAATEPEPKARTTRLSEAAAKLGIHIVK